MKVLLNSFHLNDHSLGFHLLTEQLSDFDIQHIKPKRKDKNSRAFIRMAWMAGQTLLISLPQSWVPWSQLAQEYSTDHWDCLVDCYWENWRRKQHQLIKDRAEMSISIKNLLPQFKATNFEGMFKAKLQILEEWLWERGGSRNDPFSVERGSKWNPCYGSGLQQWLNWKQWVQRLGSEFSSLLKFAQFCRRKANPGLRLSFFFLFTELKSYCSKSRGMLIQKKKAKIGHD